MPRSDFSSTGTTDTLVPSAARTASGETATFRDFGAARTIRAQLEVTAAAGTTPTLDVMIEDTVDGTNWNSVAAFTQATAASRMMLNISTPFSDRLRVRWVIGGVAPSFTFSVITYSEGV